MQYHCVVATCVRIFIRITKSFFFLFITPMQKAMTMKFLVRLLVRGLLLLLAAVGPSSFLISSNGSGGGGGGGVLLVAATASWTSSSTFSQTSSVDLWMGDAAIAVAEDTNDDEYIFETTLTLQESSQANIIIDGQTVNNAITFNNMIPGPSIRVKQGDRVIVHFVNNLNTPTTIHWHGVQGNNAADGSQLTQFNVPGNGGTFEYNFVAVNAGTHWYHPHHNTAQSLFSGAYGALIVVSPEEQQMINDKTLPDQEGILIFSDTTIDDDNGNIINIIDGVPELVNMNGVEGETLLTNGKVNPTIDIQGRQPVMLRLINACTSRYMRLSSVGASSGVDSTKLIRIGGEDGLIDKATLEGGMKMTMEMDMPMVMCTTDADCGDGNSRYSKCMTMRGHCGKMSMLDLGYDIGEIVLAPGNRANVLIVFDEKEIGSEIILKWKGFDRGIHAMDMSNPPQMCQSMSDCTDPSYPMCMLMVQGRMPMCGKMVESSITPPPRDLVTFRVANAGTGKGAVSVGTPLRVVEDLSTVMPDKIWVGTETGGGMGGMGGGMGGMGGGGRHRTMLRQQQQRDRRTNMMMMAPDMPRITLAGMMGPMGTKFSIDGVNWGYGMGSTDSKPDFPASKRDAALGEVIEIEIHNDTDMHHPFHLHGFSFQPLYFMRMHHMEGWMQRYDHDNVEFVDTIDIPEHTSVFIRVRLDDPVGDGSAMGRWLYHCHIAHHAELGMISELVVS